MLRLAIFSLVATVVGPVLAFLATNEWSLNNLPDSNATDHLVFETVHSLLQRWPNTRMRNGHNIVPGRIPKGTIFYHGSNSTKLPPGPEWVATNPRHSYIYSRDEFDGFHCGAYHLTLATTRPLKIVYFDGSSAAKLPYGSMDTQDLVAWGRLGHANDTDEQQRILDLCRWGRIFNVDGFVRMEFDFEVMLCDFTSGIRVVSSLKLVPLDFIGSVNQHILEAINDASPYNRFPGETRIELDLAGLVSFYDTQLAPSLVPIRASLERWDHRAGNVSTEDLSAVMSRLRAALVRPVDPLGGIDWKTLFQVIVDRYAQRLELTRYLLNSSATELGPDQIVDLANKTQSQLRTMLTPYLDLSAMPTDQSDETRLDWTMPIYKLCATTHTYAIESDKDSMTDAEKLLLQAVRGTSREICRVVTKMWAAGIYTGIDPLLNTKESPDVAHITRVWGTWADDLDRLMAWLDWSVWVKCSPVCGPEEICYLPTWPLSFPSDEWRLIPGNPNYPSDETATSFGPQARVMKSFSQKMWNAMKLESNKWIQPQPRCVRQVDPYEF